MIRSIFLIGLSIFAIGFNGCVSACVGGRVDVTSPYFGNNQATQPKQTENGKYPYSYYAPYTCDSYGCY